MLVAVAVVYWPPRDEGENTQLRAWDYLALHERRMNFARENLLGPRHALPAWYPRELCGTPFWANVQNFPFIPTRLLILFALDPSGPNTMAIATMLSAMLSALFTFLFCRRINLGATASAAAGFTFACSGFYASRIMCGHLPLLEAYPALPLLLWTGESLMRAQEIGIEARDPSLGHATSREREGAVTPESADRSLTVAVRFRTRTGRRTRAYIGRWVVALGASCGCIMLAGHPQLSIYSIVACGAYVLWQSVARGETFRRATRPLISMALGVGCAAFALVPMAMLVGRSTRVLPLVKADNDISVPYRRLLAWWFPWIDGAIWPVSVFWTKPFQGYPDIAYFWETITYVGWLPWIAIALLIILRPRGVGPSRRVNTFLIALALAGVVIALPVWRNVTDAIFAGTYLRCPARAQYLCLLPLAVALGVAVDYALSIRAIPSALRIGFIAIALAVHAADVTWFDWHFLLRLPPDHPPGTSAQQADFVRAVGDGRVGIDGTLIVPLNRTLDDIGFFDSVMLARPYRAFLELGGAPEGINLQSAHGSQFAVRDARALRAAAVKFVVTLLDVPTLKQVDLLPGYKTYAVPDPAERAQLYPIDRVQFLDVETIHARLRDPAFDPVATLLLPISARPESMSRSALHSAQYRRPDSDRIECTVTSDAGGFLRVIESFDPGWCATIDGQATAIWPAMDSLLCVQIPPGTHEARFEYHTPGATAGIVISTASTLGLLSVAWASSPRALLRSSIS